MIFTKNEFIIALIVIIVSEIIISYKAYNTKLKRGIIQGIDMCKNFLDYLVSTKNKSNNREKDVEDFLNDKFGRSSKFLRDE